MRIYRLLFWPWSAVFLLVAVVWPVSLFFIYPNYTIGSVFSAIGIQWSIALVGLFVARTFLSKIATKWIEATLKGLFTKETALREARVAEAKRFLEGQTVETFQETTEAVVAGLLPTGLYWMAERNADLHMVIDAKAIKDVQLIDRTSSLDHGYDVQPPRTGEGVLYRDAKGNATDAKPYVAPSKTETPLTPYDYTGTRLDIKVEVPGTTAFWISMPFEDKKDTAAQWQTALKEKAGL